MTGIQKVREEQQRMRTDRQRIVQVLLGFYAKNDEVIF